LSTGALSYINLINKLHINDRDDVFSRFLTVGHGQHLYICCNVVFEVLFLTFCVYFMARVSCCTGQYLLLTVIWVR